MLADRAAGVHRRDVRRRGRRELRAQLGHLEPAQERVVGVALEEAAAEGVEQDHADPVALAAGQQPLHLDRDVGERAHAAATLLADRPVESGSVRHGSQRHARAGRVPRTGPLVARRAQG